MITPEEVKNRIERERVLLNDEKVPMTQIQEHLLENQIYIMELLSQQALEAVVATRNPTDLVQSLRLDEHHFKTLISGREINPVPGLKIILADIGYSRMIEIIDQVKAMQPGYTKKSG